LHLIHHKMVTRFHELNTGENEGKDLNNQDKRSFILSN